MVNRHDVQPVKGPRAVGALAHSVADPVVYALVTEKMPARLQGRIFEVVPTHCAECKGLLTISFRSTLGVMGDSL